MGLYVICNMDFLAKRSEMWKNIQKSIDEVGALQNALTVKCKMHKKEQVSLNSSYHSILSFRQLLAEKILIKNVVKGVVMIHVILA